MKKFPVFLAALIVLVISASCNLPAVKEPEVKEPAVKEPEAAPTANDSAPEIGEVYLPAEKPVLEEAPPLLPDAILVFAEADYPEQTPGAEELFALPEPREQPVPAQRPEVVQQTPPPEPREETPLRETPPQETPPQRETPPPVPPALVRPSEPLLPPPPEREVPSLVVPPLPFEPVSVIPYPSENDLSYSRTVRALTGQYIEIPFRGPGWVYLGEFGSRRGVSYDSRRMETEGMTFIFRADTEGTYSLKFTRQDFVRDYILNDYVKVIVEESPVVTGSSWSNPQVRPERVYASPRWPSAIDPQGRTAEPEGRTAAEQNNQTSAQQTAQPPSQTAAPSPAAQTGGNTAGQNAGTQTGQNAGGQNAGTQTGQNAGGQNAGTQTGQNAGGQNAGTQTGQNAGGQSTGTQTGQNTGTAAQPSAGQAALSTAPDTTPAAASAEDLLKNAREEYNASRIANALRYLDQFMLSFPGGSDEAFWLYGQSLEANNEATRDIRLALDYYRRLVREYPQSSRYNEARRRIAYLERFYFNIQ